VAKFIFENLSAVQAKILDHWFEAQGEQDCEIWFEDREVDPPSVDLSRGIEKDEYGNVTVYCK